MALGAITITLDEIQGRKVQAPLFAVRVSFPGDGDYPAGGTPDFTELVRDAVEEYMAARSDANVRGRMNFTIMALIGGDCGAYVPLYDDANDKLKVLVGATWVQNATANISGTTFNVTLICS